MKSSISIVRTLVNVVAIDLAKMEIVTKQYPLFIGDTTDWDGAKVMKALAKTVDTDGMKYASHKVEKALVTIDHSMVWEHGEKDFDGYRK